MRNTTTRKKSRVATLVILVLLYLNIPDSNYHTTYTKHCDVSPQKSEALNIKTCEVSSVNKVEYRVIPETQTVMNKYYVETGGKMKNCEVFNAKNWTCKNDTFTQVMKDGRYSELKGQNLTPIGSWESISYPEYLYHNAYLLLKSL